MYLTQRSGYREIAIDIETDDLDAKVIWCLCWEDIDSDTSGVIYDYRQIKEFVDNPLHTFVGHNSLKFDIPTINRLTGSNVPLSRCLDTLVYSTLYSPSLAGGHSLEAWGDRMGEPKSSYDDFSRLTDELVKRCQSDAHITKRLFKGLRHTLAKIGFTEKALEIQHKITVILERQRKNGFYFDGPRALNFYTDLRARERAIGDDIHVAFPPERQLVRTGKVFTKDGSRTAILERDLGRFQIVYSDGGGTYEAYEDVPFNIGSPKQRVEKLLELGWIPDEFTKPSKLHPKGQPKVTEKSLLTFAESSGIPEVGLIATWMSVNGRANMVNTWLENWNERDYCIHGKLFVADTLRFRHQAPNTANIPAVRIDKLSGKPLRGELGLYTYESRDLWTARPGRVLVGTDAAGLELRMLAHYINRPEFFTQVIEGDPHQYNADLAGVSRPNAKTLLYAIMYGAQAAKVGRILGTNPKQGGAMRIQFLERLGIDDVMNEAIDEFNNGRIELVDGSRVICPSEHAALNYKLQGGGARVMAQGAIFLEGKIHRAGLDSLKVGDIHDEWQYDVDPRDSAEHARLSVEAIREAGEELNLRLPLDGTAKEGLTWAQTH